MTRLRQLQPNWLKGYAFLYVVFLYLPVVFLPIFSFNTSATPRFPLPHSEGLNRVARHFCQLA